MIKTNLDKSYMEGSDLSHANLQGSSLYKTSLQGAYLFGTNLNNTYLMETNLQSANLELASLENANLYSANLQSSILQYTNLQGANLFSANLQGALLKHVTLYNVDLYNANLQGAYLEGTTLICAKNLDKIDRNPLTQEKAKKLIKIVKNTIYSYVPESNKKIQNKIIKSINSAIDKDPISWLKEQDVIASKLTKEEIKQICDSFTIDNDVIKEAKERVGCDKVKPNKSLDDE
jgi:hypothetical protein